MRDTEPRVDRVQALLLVVAFTMLPFLGQIAILPMAPLHSHYIGFLYQMLFLVPLSWFAWVGFASRPADEIGVRPLSGRLTGNLIGLGTANLLVIGFAVSLLLTLVYPPELVRDQLRQLNDSIVAADTGPERMWMLLSVVVGAPIAEELLYRGLIQNLLVRFFRPFTAILVTSVIFAVMHWQITRYPAVFEIAVVLGVVYHRTRSIWASILVHAVNNGLVATAFLWPELHQSIFGPGAILLGIPALVIFARMLLRDTATTEQPDHEPPPMFRFSRLLQKAGPFWVAMIALSFLAYPLAGKGGRELTERMPELVEINREINTAWATDPAWSEFSAIRSACRGAIKRGKLPVDDYIAWLTEARDTHIAALGDLEPQYLATAPNDAERAVLDTLRADVETRFGIDVPDPLPLY